MARIDFLSFCLFRYFRLFCILSVSTLKQWLTSTPTRQFRITAFWTNWEQAEWVKFIWPKTHGLGASWR